MNAKLLFYKNLAYSIQKRFFLKEKNKVTQTRKQIVKRLVDKHFPKEKYVEIKLSKEIEQKLKEEKDLVEMEEIKKEEVKKLKKEQEIEQKTEKERGSERKQILLKKEKLIHPMRRKALERKIAKTIREKIDKKKKIISVLYEKILELEKLLKDDELSNYDRNRLRQLLYERKQTLEQIKDRLSF